MKNILLTLAVLSFMALSYAVTLEPYTDAHAFEEKYAQLSVEDGSQQYWDLRESYLTEKYALQEFSAMVLVLSLLGFVWMRAKEVPTPPSKKMVYVWGVAASLLFAIYYVASVVVDQGRGAFAYWADSIAIPLMATPVMFVLLLCVFWFHSTLKHKTYYPAYNLKQLRIQDFKSYFGLISMLHILLLILTVGTGWSPEPSMGFMLVLFLVVSLYIHLSLLKNKKHEVARRK
jgi:membrane protein YdbS with pleckstrin-like domain